MFLLFVHLCLLLAQAHSKRIMLVSVYVSVFLFIQFTRHNSRQFETAQCSAISTLDSIIHINTVKPCVRKFRKRTLPPTFSTSVIYWFPQNCFRNSIFGKFITIKYYVYKDTHYVYVICVSGLGFNLSWNPSFFTSRSSPPPFFLSHPLQ